MASISMAIAACLACAGCRDLPADPPPVDAAPAAATVRAATFNVRRFFDTVCDSGACGPADYEALPTQAEFDARATQIADAIRLLDADVVALEEVETQACLDALLARIGDAMPYGVLGEIGGAATVDVAVLSRTPLDAVVRHRADTPLALPGGGTTTFSRELLEVHVTTHATPLILFAAHFKSKSGDDPPRRLAEAQASAHIIDATAAANPGAIVLLGGDLNDTPGSPPLDALTVDGDLVRLADDLLLPDQETYFYGGTGEIIDHLLLAPTEVAATRVPKSSRVWVDAHATGFGGSDHRALTTDLAIR